MPFKVKYLVKIRGRIHAFTVDLKLSYIPHPSSEVTLWVLGGYRQPSKHNLLRADLFFLFSSSYNSFSLEIPSDDEAKYFDLDRRLFFQYGFGILDSQEVTYWFTVCSPLFCTSKQHSVH